MDEDRLEAVKTLIGDICSDASLKNVVEPSSFMVYIIATHEVQWEFILSSAKASSFCIVEAVLN